MARPKLKPVQDSEPAAPSAAPQSIPLPMLNIAGVVLKKADLIDALRVYVPLLVDIQVFEDNEHFFLVVDASKKP